MGRKKMMALNAITVMIMTGINVILGMFEVKYLIQSYGSTVNGLMQTGNQLLSYLSLLETGICGAYLYSMYKPVAEKDDNKLSALYKGFIINTRKAIIKMLIIALGLSFIYPLLLKKDGLPYSFMVIVFSLLSVKTILPYLVTIVPRYMIILLEQRYKVELISGLTRMLTYLCEIIVLLYTQLTLPVLLLICILISLLSGFVFQVVMRKMYGSRLENSSISEDAPRGMSKDVTVHTVSRLVFNGTDNIIISTLGRLSDVTIYSNYNLIVSQVSTIASSIFDGASASIGVKIANKDENTYDVYRKLLGIALLVGGIFTSVFIVMINEFVINIWVGKEYVVSELNCILFGYIMYAGIVFPCLSVPRNAKGLYKESKWFTILQAVVNLAITIATVPYWGITGALLGTFIARIFITIPCNYSLVQHHVFPNVKSRMWELPASAFVTLFASILTKKIISFLQIGIIIQNKLLCFICNGIVSTLICGGLLISWFLFSDNSIRQMIFTSIQRIRIKLNL